MGDMRSLRIKVFKGSETNPETTCTIPAAVLKVAARLIPKQAMAALRDKGIELEEIIKLSSDQEVHGTLLEVEDHKKSERVVIALD
jgi:hypothetical protein